MTEKYTRFITLLKSMFELDKSDLDFGVYRIINMRKEQISDFLDNKLQQKVLAALSGIAVDDNKVNDRIAEIEKTATDMGLDPQDIPKFKDEYAQLKSQINTRANITELETDVYSALYNFFNRYYDEGDFISKRRYKEGVYAIPYEGEEVKLYWANYDQYYIKTSENFKDYAFKVGGKTVHFSLVDATTETGNNKEDEKHKRKFMLLEESFIEEIEDELIFKFIYDIPQDKSIKYNLQNIERMKSALMSDYKGFWANELLRSASRDPKKPKTLLQKHYDSYVAKNSFDYFIHKDLRGFLSRELDFFIKSEIMHLDDIDTNNEVRVSTYIAKVKAIKRVGKDIINFLAQIEDFQKKLWLKKKFVVETNWCITLDKIDEKFYEEIIANEAQVEEWCNMYAINETQGDLTTIEFSKPLTVEFLKANSNLLIDTKYFTGDFKDKLIASINNLDEQTNGLLIHSENFQALNLLQEKYREQIKCVYIDPPYNTNASPIIYKNGYRDSSWISLISERFLVLNKLLAKGTIVTTAIDHAEIYNLGQVLNLIYGVENRIAIVTVQHNPKGRNQAEFFSENTEYLLVYSNDILHACFNDVAIDDAVKETFTQKDKNGNFRWENFIRARSSWSRTNRPNNWYPIYVSNDMNIITSTFTEGYYEVFPKTKNGEFSWKKIKSSFDEQNKNGYFMAEIIDGEVIIRHKYNENQVLRNLWVDKKYQSEFNGTNILKAMFGNAREFSYPKSIFAVGDMIKLSAPENGIVLDYFAGSGTTAHAVINLNREEKSNRKYILVEMGEYFNTVTKPRVKKVIYSADWKNGMPKNRNTGVSQILKYIRLESYEDTLQNIEMDNQKHDTFSVLGENYLLSYMLNTESEDSLLNLNMFKAPFSYKLKITDKNESKEKSIDLCETFNYLIGLNVVRQSEIKTYSTSTNAYGTYKGAVKLDCDKSGTHSFKIYEGKLRTGEKTLVIWRTITHNLLLDNAALDAFFAENFIQQQDREFDLIFINGDNNLENLRIEGETWKINLIELEMKKRMFEGV